MKMNEFSIALKLHHCVHVFGNNFVVVNVNLLLLFIIDISIYDTLLFLKLSFVDL